MAVNKKALEKVLDTMSSRIDEEFREKFSENFPKLAEKLEKTSEDNLDTIRFYIDYERRKLNEGSIKHYKNLQYNRERKHNMVVSGILDGTFYEALEIACDDYTDMAWKFFKRVYIYLTTGKELPVYEEFTEKEITEWYNKSEWAKEKYSSLEERSRLTISPPSEPPSER